MHKRTYKIKQQNNNIDTKPPNVSDCLKSLIQKAKEMMGDIEEEDGDIDKYKLAFLGDNKE